MGQYDDKVEKQRLLLLAEKWAEGVKTIHAHSISSMWYDTRPQDTEDGKSVLDAALQNQLDVPYSCQGGVCSSCMARVKSGTAVMATNQILTDEEVEEGLILTCQAHATSSHLAVDYDDV